MNELVVIDDDELTLDLIARRLRGSPVRVKCFRDSELAIKCLTDHSGVVLLVDYNMPGQNGLEVLRKLACAMDFDFTRAYLCSAAELPDAIGAEARSLGVAIQSKDLYRNRDQLVELATTG